MTWGLGHYDHIATMLEPAAMVVVDRLAPRPGEHVVDVGCGTGNAALAVARRGARSTGVDPAPRLLDVARRASGAQGLEVTFVSGEAAALPFPDSSVDAVVSVFGLIFAPDPQAAAAELARVLVGSGRLVFSAWLPGGPLAEQARLRREAVAGALGEQPGRAPFAWHDTEAVSGLLAPHGFSVEAQAETLAFTAASALEFAQGEWEHHPLWVEARAVLEPAGVWPAVRAATLQVFSAANEDPLAFRISSHYVVVSARRPPSPSMVR
ncbi:MAG TPA: methyltransferase domain-containing protein [Acidimicrobiales bacterium]|nr:methyltransferase domain-containing protein [Acidimicrobiales bacterium]